MLKILLLRFMQAMSREIEIVSHSD